MRGKTGRSRISDPRHPEHAWINMRALPAHVYPAPPPMRRNGTGRQFSYLGNDRWGCCTVASLGHYIQLCCQMMGEKCSLTENDVLDVYRFSGWDGTDATDNGWMIVEALTAVKHAGLGRYKADNGIVDFARLDLSDSFVIPGVVNLLGGVIQGLALPKRINSQGNTWDLPAVLTADDDYGSDGGHADLVTGYDAVVEFTQPWVTETVTTGPWNKKYRDEAWAVLFMPFVEHAAMINGFDPGHIVDAFRTLKSNS